MTNSNTDKQRDTTNAAHQHNTTAQEHKQTWFLDKILFTSLTCLVSSCDRIKSMTGVIFAMTFLSTFGALLSFGGMIVGCLAHGQVGTSYASLSV